MVLEGNVDPGFINAPRIMTFFLHRFIKVPRIMHFLGGRVVVVGYSLLL